MYWKIELLLQKEGLFYAIKPHKQADKHILLAKKHDSHKKALSLRAKMGRYTPVLS